MKEKCSTIIQWNWLKSYTYAQCVGKLGNWEIVPTVYMTFGVYITLYSVRWRREECAWVYACTRAAKMYVQIRANNEELWQKFFGAHQFTFLIVCILLKCYLYTIFSTLLNILEFLLIVHVCTRNRQMGAGRGQPERWNENKKFFAIQKFSLHMQKDENYTKTDSQRLVHWQQHFPIIISSFFLCFLFHYFIPLLRCTILIIYICATFHFA